VLIHKGSNQKCTTKIKSQTGSKYWEKTLQDQKFLPTVCDFDFWYYLQPWRITVDNCKLYVKFHYQSLTLLHIRCMYNNHQKCGSSLQIRTQIQTTRWKEFLLHKN
jgi:hypothetical protein